MLFRLLAPALLLTISLAAQRPEWDEPLPPHRIADNLYFVGSKGLSTYLLTSPAGHILINSSFERTVPIIQANVESLGFKLTDVKILLASHAHDDHVAGHRLLQKLTGAQVYVMTGDDRTIATGGAEGQYLYNSRWAPTAVDRVLKDREVVTLGGWRLTAHRTPGHTRGNTTWSFTATDGGKSYRVVIVGSPNVNPGYQLVNNSAYPNLAADFAQTFKVLKGLQCDIFLGAHGDYYGMLNKVARLKPGSPNPFIDPAGYREYVAEREQYYLYTLEKQKNAAAAANYFPPPDSQGGWRTKSDPAVTAKLDAVLEYVQRTTQHGGLLVVHHGHLIYEKYFGRGHREALPELASTGKAFTSLATAIVMRERPELFPQGLDTKIFSPKLLPAEAFPLNDPRKEQISIGQVLSMAAGLKGTNPVYVKGVRQTWDSPTEDNGPYSTTDGFALRQPLWCAPGECYSYSTASSHVPAAMVRHVSGIEMEEYMRKHLTTPLGFGTWGYAMYRPKLKGGIDSNGRMLHTPGGGSIAVRSTDMLRFGYLLLRQGRWGKRQVVPAEFVALCGKSVSYNPHYTHSFNFNVNDDGHVKALPKDAFWKGGAGGHGIYIVPSLDLVVFKLGGNEGQYDPALTRLPVPYTYDGSRDSWKAPDPKILGDTSPKTLEMVVGALSGNDGVVRK